MTRRWIDCGDCGASWPRASARFCGHCGASLWDPLHPVVAKAGTRPRRRWRLALAGGSLGLPASVLAVAALVHGVQLDGGSPAATEVELPDTTDVERDDATVRSVAEPLPGALGCEPEGCARWEAAVGDGAYLVVEGSVVQASETAVRAVDASTGRTSWRYTYEQDQLPTVLERPRVQQLGEDRLAIMAAGGLLQIRGLEDGKLRWSVDLGVDQLVEVVEHGDLVVVAGWPLRNRQHPPARIAAFEQDDGALRWEHAALRAVSIETDPLVIQPRNRELLGLDARTGEPRWSGQVSGPVRALVTEEVLGLVTPTGVSLVDVATGEEQVRHPRAVSDAGDTRLAGALLLIDAPSGPDPSGKPRSTMTVVAASDPAAVPERYADTTGVLPVEDGGLVLVAQTDAELRVVRLDAGGDLVWEQRRELAADRCCWSVHASGDAATFYLVPPRLDRDAVEVLAIEDGEARASFEIPTSVEHPVVSWSGGVAVLADLDGTTLTGPQGSARVGRGAALLATEPWPIVDVQGGLLALQLAGEPHTPP